MTLNRQSFFKSAGFAFSFFVLLTREQLPNLVFTYVPVDTTSIALTISQNASAAIDLHIQDFLSNQYTAADVLAKIKTVDGADSGLDADLLDGLDSTHFQQNLADMSNVELGISLTGDRISIIDLHSSGGVDYSARIIRQPGADGALEIVQTGGGELKLVGGGNFTRNGNTIWHDGLGAKSFSPNGYQKLPSGLIIQWGFCSSQTEFSTPIAFPTVKCISIGTHVGYELVTIINDLNYAHNLSQCKFLDNYGSVPVGVHWIAIGY